MRLEVTHSILVQGQSFSECREHVLGFFAKTTLVHYDGVRVVEEESFSADDARFEAGLEKGIGANRQALKDLLAELQEGGSVALQDLIHLPQGYQSKVIHTLAHLLDGFIGIDTCFYNLLDDSHWLDESRRAAIKDSPKEYWLLLVHGYLEALGGKEVAALRTFER